MFASCSPKKKPANVVLLTIDAARADHYGCYGQPDAATPVIDQLAKEGILIEHAYCQVPMTLPSHTSILTGLQPPSHGIRLNGAYKLSPEIDTLATILKKAGYQTAAFISAFVLNGQFGLNQAFDVYEDDIVSLNDGSLEEPERRGDETTAKVIEWIEASDEKPFFLWVHLFDPHAPYDPPEPYKSACPGNPYQGEIAFADAMVGDILAALAAKGVAASTLIVYTSDHGEGLYEHKEDTHSLFVYDSTLRIPLVLRCPETFDAQAYGWSPGLRIQQPAQSVDIAPTILDILGIKAETAFDGHSLLEKPDEEEYYAYAESLYPLNFGWAPLRTARRQEWKYIASPDPELYNIVEDPDELQNVASAHPQVISSLDAWLNTYYELCESREDAKGIVAPETAAALRSLGYSGGSAVNADSASWLNLPAPMGKVSLYDAINKARTEGHAGRDEKAVALLMPLVAEEPDNAILLQVLGFSLVRLGRYDEGIPLIEQYRRLLPDDPEASYFLGLSWYRKGNPQQAIEPLTKATKLLPTYAAAWDQLGAVNAHLGNWPEALEAGEQAVKYEPYNPQYLRNYGMTLLNVGQPDKAEQVFKRALANLENAEEAQYGLGVALHTQQKFLQAAEIFDDIIERNPTNYNAQSRLVETWYSLGKHEQAGELLQNILGHLPADPVANFYAGRIALDKGQPDQAVEHLIYAIKGMPKFEAAYQLLQTAFAGSTANHQDQINWFEEQARKNAIRLPSDQSRPQPKS